MHARSAAMRAFHLGLVDVGDVMLLGEFLVAVFAMKYVLRHGVQLREKHSAGSCECGMRPRIELAVWRSDCQHKNLLSVHQQKGFLCCIVRSAAVSPDLRGDAWNKCDRMSP